MNEQVKEIVKEFKGKLIDIIHDSIVKKYLEDNNNQFPNFEEEEEIVIEPTDSLKGVKVKVEVHDTYLENYDRIYEFHKITALKVALDDTVFVELEGYEDDEFELAELSLDDIVTIAMNF